MYSAIPTGLGARHVATGQLMGSTSVFTEFTHISFSLVFDLGVSRLIPGLLVVHVLCPAVLMAAGTSAMHFLHQDELYDAIH